MSITLCHRGPGCRKNPVGTVDLVARSVEDGLTLAPYAYIRIVFLDPGHEIVVVVVLVRPHSVLDVPAHDPEGGSITDCMVLKGPYLIVVKIETICTVLGVGCSCGQSEC